MRKLQTLSSVLVQQLSLDPNLECQLAASQVHVHAAPTAMAVATLKAEALVNGPIRLVELTAMACQRMLITLQPTQLGLGLIRQGVISTEANGQRRFSKEAGQLFYLVPPNQSVVLHFLSPSTKWHHLCVSTEALASSCQSIGMKPSNWSELTPPHDQSCALLNTLIQQLQTKSQPEASAQMILLHLASHFGLGSNHKMPVAAAPPRSEAMVQKAVGFFQAQLHRTISLTEVSAFCGISPRRLQAAFQSCLGCTPMEALLKERLKAMRTHLLAGVSVARSCERAGLRCSGRIARLYLNEYGELPRETLSGKFRPVTDQTASSENIA